MQIIENEIRQRQATLRKAGGRGYVIKYPSDIAEALGFKSGTMFEQFVNNKGEMVVRPLAMSGPEKGGEA